MCLEPFCPSSPEHRSSFCSFLSLSLIAECEMTHGTRQSAGHTQLSGNEKWCWCQRWNRPNHPWAELHNSNIILLLPLLFYPLSPSCPLAHSPSLTLSSNRFDFYSSMFQWHHLSSEVCAGIGMRIKSLITARHAGKGQEVENEKYTHYACWCLYLVLLFYLSGVCLCLYCVLFKYFTVCLFECSICASLSATSEEALVSNNSLTFWKIRLLTLILKKLPLPVNINLQPSFA